MIDVPLAYAFTAGLVASVNPCGFPMLPAYLSYFIGTDGPAAERASRVPRALVAAAAVSAGFMTVFAVLGVPINAGVTSIYRWIPWVTIVIGVAMAALGVAMLAGFRLKVALPRLEVGGGSRGLGSMALFGVSYAVASLTCTLPVFLVVVAGTAERANALSGVVAFLAYGLGMSLVLTALALALALARESMVNRLRRAVRHANRAAGALLVMVGTYLVYYWAYNLTRDPTATVGASPISVVDGWSSSATAWLSEGGTSLGLVLGGAVVGALVGALLWRRSGGGSVVTQGGVVVTAPVAAGVDVDQGVREAGEAVEKGVSDTLGDVVAGGDVEVLVDEDADRGVELVADPAHPHVGDAVHAVDAGDQARGAGHQVGVHGVHEPVVDVAGGAPEHQHDGDGDGHADEGVGEGEPGRHPGRSHQHAQ